MRVRVCADCVGLCGVCAVCVCVVVVVVVVGGATRVPWTAPASPGAAMPRAHWRGRKAEKAAGQGE